MKRHIKLAILIIISIGLLSWGILYRDEKIKLEGIYSNNFIPDRVMILNFNIVRQDKESIAFITNGIINELLMMSYVDETVGDASFMTIRMERISAENKIEFYRNLDVEEMFKISNANLNEDAKSRIRNIVNRLKSTGSIYRNFQ